MFKFTVAIVATTMVTQLVGAQLVVGTPDGMTSWTRSARETFLSESETSFTRGTNEWGWNSDIEHVVEKTTHEVFLADAKKPYYLCGDTIPAGKTFELFPYHYYDKKEEQQLGTKINYTLALRNDTTQTATVQIAGIGTTADWDHYKAWQGALRGEGSKTITIKPGGAVTVCKEVQLEGGLPWSAIVLGRTDTEIKAYDYCYTSSDDPGIAHAQPIPDLAWPPYLLASFSRGSSNWISASIEWLTKARDGAGNVKLSAFNQRPAVSIAFGYSPGGPVTMFAEYKYVQPTFREDQLYVKDPLTSYSHLFFGGNYPIMYTMKIPVINDTAVTKTLSFHLCSNDKFKVDTIAGVWIRSNMLACRVPSIWKDSRWNVWTLALPPSAKDAVDMTIVPLGSRWGGMIATLAIDE